jgi:hypothetical protein
MQKFGLLFLFSILFSCQSFDTNTNLESEFTPGPAPAGTDLEDHVDQSLKKMYPKIGKYKILIKQKTCLANFIMGGNIYEVKFDLDGNWKESQVIIAYDFTLPGGVQEYLKNDEFKGWILSERKLNQTPEEIQYKFIWKRGEELKSVWLNRNGEVIRDKVDVEQLVK